MSKQEFIDKNLNKWISKTLIEAAEAYDSKAKELYGEFANINFPIM